MLRIGIMFEKLKRDLKCGKLICEYTSERIINIPNASATYINVSGHRCVALEFPHNDKDSTKMWVRDGTVSDSNTACRNKECVDVGFLGYDCTAEKCNSPGICNNKKHCHCNPTYLPPNCQLAQDAWPGGSIDSGNIPPQDSLPSNLEVRVNPKHSLENSESTLSQVIIFNGQENGKENLHALLVV
ncbi:Disintegrin And Metalloproteinase Domain-Containing Protein 2 [Manis pentadactyla]|nr:Disintegrin And Metalloproteinase Domain-Containing Protein 2 [Manis pentadactyla]